jgi:hypothetical protein
MERILWSVMVATQKKTPTAFSASVMRTGDYKYFGHSCRVFFPARVEKLPKTKHYWK